MKFVPRLVTSSVHEYTVAVEICAFLCGDPLPVVCLGPFLSLHVHSESDGV